MFGAGFSGGAPIRPDDVWRSPLRNLSLTRNCP
jgi:hypothetical protein